jgi:hypothetical protein
LNLEGPVRALLYEFKKKVEIGVVLVRKIGKNSRVFTGLTDLMHYIGSVITSNEQTDSEYVMQNFLLRIFLIAFPTVLGILFIGFGIRNHSLGKQSESWPTVQGTFVSESSSMRKKKRIHIFYEYQIKGVSYKNSRVNFQDDKDSKRKIRDKYKVGDTLTVHYDPNNPEESVLAPGATTGSLIIKILGGFFCFSLAGIFMMMRRR